MTEELKARIAQINAGTAPEGYKKTKVGIVPEEWEICHFKKQFARLKRKNTEGNTNVLTISAQYGLINQEEFFKKEVASEDKSNYYLLFRGDFAYNKSYSNGYPFGAFKMLDRYDSGVVSPLYICFTPTESNACPAYYVQYFENGMMNREIQAVAQEGARNHGLLNISIDDFFNSYLLCPPFPEQQKIAEILTAQDAVIALMQKQIELKQQQKKALMQKLLSGEVRVGDGEWKTVRLGQVLSRVANPVNVEKNLYYRQIGLRSHGNGIFYKEEVTGAKLGNKAVFWVEPNCFILNIVFAWEQAIGKTTDKEAGMIASHRFPMYKPHGISLDYLIYYFMTKRGTTLLELASPGGAGRNRTLGQEHFLKSIITYPPLPEQEKIAKILSTQDREIELMQQQLTLEQQKKKALMQLLLTGKVRVKT